MDIQVLFSPSPPPCRAEVSPRREEERAGERRGRGNKQQSASRAGRSRMEPMDLSLADCKIPGLVTQSAVEFPVMRIWPNTSKARRILATALIFAVAVVLWIIWVAYFDKPSRASLARILVLDDSDSDFKTPPFEDCVYAFQDGKLIRKVADLNVCQTVGGDRSLSATRDGRTFLVCENVGNHLTAYNTQTGERRWRLDGRFQSATVSSDGSVYALSSAGTIYGDEALVINERGGIERKAKIGGFDLVVDDERKVLWTVGANIKKCDLALNILWETNLISWCAVSVDLNPDGSVWVAERDHQDVSGSQDRLLKISSSGELLKVVKLDFSPFCLRVNQTNGDVWVTGGRARDSKTRQLLEWIEKRTGRLPLWNGARKFLMRQYRSGRTEKLDHDGNLLRKLDLGGHTLAIDPADNSVWVAGSKILYQYSSEGQKLGRLRGLSDSQSYVIVLPVAPVK